MENPETNPQGHLLGETSAAAMAALLGIIALALRVLPFAQQSLSVDEGVIWATCKFPLSQIVSRLISLHEVHPPLYFLLQALWMRLGDSELMLRLPSMLCGTLLVVLAYAWFRRLGSPFTATLGTLLMALSAFQMLYSREARMYPLLSLLCLASLYCFTRLAGLGGPDRKGLPGNRIPWGPAYVASTLLALYVHYYALLILLVQVCYLAFSGRSGRPAESSGSSAGSWILRLLLVGLGFLPWFLVQYFLTGKLFYQAGAQDLSLRFKPGLLQLVMVYFDLTFSHTLKYVPYSALATALLVLAACAWALGSLAAPQRLFLALVLFLPPLAAWTLSAFTPIRIYEFKYFMVITPALWFLLAAFVTRVPWRTLGSTALVFLVAVNLTSAANYTYNPDYANQDWRGLAQRIKQSGSPADFLVVEPAMNWSALGYYYRGPATVFAADQLPPEWDQKRRPNCAYLWFCVTPTHPLEQRIHLGEWFSRRFDRLASYQEPRQLLFSQLRVEVFRVGGKARIPGPPLAPRPTALSLPGDGN